MDNLADADALTEIDKEKEEEKERSKSLRRSSSKTPEGGSEKDPNEVGCQFRTPLNFFPPFSPHINPFFMDVDY